MFQNRTHFARIAVTAAGVLLLAALLAWIVAREPDSAVAAPSTEHRLLTFSGTGTAQIAPDTATISASVSGTGNSADDAQAAASRKMRKLVAHMRGLGLAASQLKTEDASVYEDWEQEGRFVANQSLAIEVEDPANAGKLLGEATAAGADSASGPSFGLEDQRAGYDEALRTAIADARAKADAAAVHMDAKVTAVYSIGEATSVDGGPVYEMALTTAAPRMKSSTVPVEEGTQPVTMNVEVSFTYER